MSDDDMDQSFDTTVLDKPNRALPQTDRGLPPLNMDWRRSARLGLAVIGIAFGGSAAWALVAGLDSAAIADGVVSAESNRKTVQHYEGGIIRDIRVRDGDHVDEGQVLFVLDDTQARANLDAVRNQRAAALAEEARLVAERDGKESISFPQESLERQNDTAVHRTIEDQQRAFQDRRAYIKNQVDSLQARVGQAQEKLAGSEEANKSAIKQLEWIDKELPALRTLYDKGLVQWPRITALERQRAQMEGTIGQTAAAMAESRQAIDQAKFDMAQVGKGMQQEVAQRIIDVRKQLSDLAEKLKVAEDVMNRLTVLAPQTGVVQGLKFFTRGAVIRPGDALLDIAPLNEALVILAQIQPTDMDVVQTGLEAEVRFPSFHLGQVPFILGTVKTLSYDRLIDQKNQNSYFAAEIVVDPKTIPDQIKDRLRPGMPAQVMIATGERTPFEYLTAPLFNRLRKTMVDGH
ncbi:Membrane fusion protein (MFP) family protein [Hyphomicrobiales bacterium]|nr:Membrane fusion protein (MFP) family protein [Hyphomicrobiales bacterium]CAH1675073.1 Membrane fusion protein (MFP) family protein [Hyphomicrobiales bacterium]